MPIHISHNLSIALWFVAYVGLIFLFAVFYFRLYREDPARFAFAADVRNAQRESFQKRTNDQVFVLTQEIEVFRYLSEKLSRKQTPVDLANEKIDVRISDDASFRLFMAGTSQSKSDDQRYPTVAIMGPGDVQLKRFILTFPSLLARWEDVLMRYENKAVSQKRFLEQRLLKFIDDPFDVWSYSDFLYFSTICQSTVGFGDILPNSTIIRRLVVIQIILGYAILVVAINTLVGSQP